MSEKIGTALRPGDRVVASRDLDRASDLHVPVGTAGTVAEDRGSSLVVSFDTDVQLCSLSEQDITRIHG